MDVRESITPKSDQLNADDLLTGAVTVKIAKVSPGAAEQQIDVGLEEFPTRVYRPSKSMRRVLVAAWGYESKAWVGRSMTLFCNPEIMFGGDKVGGIQISHLGHLEKPLTVSLTTTRSKRKPFTVQPLTTEPLKDESGRDWLKELAMAGDDLDAIGTLGAAATAAHANDKILQMVRTKYADVKKGGTK